jgi:hypothetical protein
VICKTTNGWDEGLARLKGGYPKRQNTLASRDGQLLLAVRCALWEAELPVWPCDNIAPMAENLLLEKKNPISRLLLLFNTRIVFWSTTHANARDDWPDSGYFLRWICTLPAC